MKNIMMTTVAMTLACSVPPFATAQTTINQPDPGPVEAAPVSKRIVDVDLKKTIDSYNEKNIDITKKKVDVDVTKTIDSHNEKTVDSNNQKTKTTTYTNSGDSKASGAFGAAANNSSTATTKLDLNLTNAFNKTTVVNATKLDGYVSGNTIHDIGNTGGYAQNNGNGGYGGNGGDAKVFAHSGKANGGKGGNGGDSEGGYGGNGGKSFTKVDADGGYARNGEKGKGHATQTAAGGAGGTGGGGGGGAGAAGGASGPGGAGGNGGSAATGAVTASASGGNGGAGGALHVTGGDAGTFNASNTLTNAFNGAAGINFAIQNTGAASLQQVGVTTLATIGSLPGSLSTR